MAAWAACQKTLFFALNCRTRAIRSELDNAGAAVEAMRDFMQNADPTDNVGIRELIEDGRAKR